MAGFPCTFPCDQLLQSDVFPDHQQRLSRILQHVVDLAAFGPRIDLLAFDEQRYGPPAFDGLEQADLELRPEGGQQAANAVERESPASQIGEDHQLEQLNRRVAPLSVAACFGLVRSNRGNEQATRVPPLQLSGAEARQRSHLA